MSSISTDNKSPLISVIVPTYFSEKYLTSCLASIKMQTYKNIEIIVVDSNSKDRTRAIAKEFTNKYFFNQAFERSAKRNFGAKNSLGEYILIIDSDMQLTPKVVESCVAAMKLNINLKAVVIPEGSIGNSFWAKCKGLERSFYVNIPWMEAARFFKRDIFIEIGGYDETNTGSEDYDLPQRIAHKFGENVIGRVSDLIYQDEVDLTLFDSCRKKFYYAKSFKKYANDIANRKNFKNQSSFIARFNLFFKNPKMLFADPFLGFGMLFMKTCEFGFGGVGYLYSRIKQ